MEQTVTTGNVHSFSLLKVVAIIFISFLVGGLVGAAGLYYRYKPSFEVVGPPDSLYAPSALTQKELVQHQADFKKNFRPGCPLKDKSTFTFDDGIVVSGYFASCGADVPQRTYKSAVLHDRDVILETVVGSTNSVPVITVYGVVSNVASSSQVFKAISEASALQNEEMKLMTRAERDIIDPLRMYFAVAGKHVVLYQVDKATGPYFDVTSLEVTGVSTRTVKVPSTIPTPIPTKAVRAPN